MKRIIAVLLACSLILYTLSGCSYESVTNNDTVVDALEESETKEAVTDATELVQKLDDDENQNQNVIVTETYEIDDVNKDIPTFASLDDPALLQYVEDTVYVGLEARFASEDYIIEEVSAVYLSNEYLEEVAYNSKANIWFGYTLAELDEQFQGQSYVFSLGDNGETEVEPFEDYDDTYEKVIKNVAIGTGVILVCVTVSVVTGGAGVAPVSMIFAASAKTATTMAISSGTFSAIFAGTITGIQTKDFDAAMKAAALQGSEDYKWGAISGAVVGEAGKAVDIKKEADRVKIIQAAMEGAEEWRQAELRALMEYGGKEQATYLEGQEVPFGIQGATRPDVVRTVGDHLEAIEVKFYNLESRASRSVLYRELEREVSDRIVNMPKGTTQRIVLDVTGRGFSEETVTMVQKDIWMRLADIYPNIPIDVVGL